MFKKGEPLKIMDIPIDMGKEIYKTEKIIQQLKGQIHYRSH